MRATYELIADLDMMRWWLWVKPEEGRWVGCPVYWTDEARQIAERVAERNGWDLDAAASDETESA